MKVALVTAVPARALDDDMDVLLAAFAAAGIAAEVAAWDDDSVDWAAYDAALLRSTWNYIDRYDDFLAWAARVSAVTSLLNPFAVVEWNTDKRYLADLERAGVPIVPSRFFEPGDSVGASAVEFVDAGEVVVKPCISVGSRDTGRFAADDPAAVRHLERLLDAGRPVMTQPYLASVDQIGETAVVMIDGRPSHAIRKGPLLQRDAAGVAGLFLEEHISERVAADDEQALGIDVLSKLPGIAALAAVDHALTYARVDMLRHDDGSLALLELELTEPSLFLAADPAAAGRLVDAVKRRLG